MSDARARFAYLGLQQFWVLVCALALAACGNPAPSAVATPDAAADVPDQSFNPPASEQASDEEEPPAQNVDPQPPGSNPQPDPASEAEPRPHQVPLAPVGREIPCENETLEFTFSGSPGSFDAATAFWMMWVAVRAFVSELPTTREEFASLGYTRYAWLDNPRTGLQGFVAGSEHTVLLAFRGSEEFIDWMVDFRIGQRDGEELGLTGKVHRGFANVLEGSWDDIERLVSHFASDGQPIWVTGHSMGAAVATLAAARLANAGYNVGPLYSFAGPRAGDQLFAQDLYSSLDGRHYRFVNGGDLVPRLPPTAAAAFQMARIIRAKLPSAWLENWLHDLAYAHNAAMWLLGPDGSTTTYPVSDDVEDAPFWEALADACSVDRLSTLITESLAQGERHNEGTYLCRMRALYAAHETSEH